MMVEVGGGAVVVWVMLALPEVGRRGMKAGGVPGVGDVEGA